MIDFPALVVLLGLLAVPLSWLLPRHLAMDGVALWTALVLALFSPFTALCLFAATVLTPLCLTLADRSRWRSAMAGLWVLVILAPLVCSRFALTPALVGSAYFTLRLLHVVAEWWLRRAPVPALRDHVRYQLFLPVLVAGPINRLDHFTRQCDRRRPDAGEILSGMERVLIGAVMVWPLVRLFDHGLRVSGIMTALGSGFAHDWLASAIDWIRLYFTFAGMTGMGLGIALMMGLRLEENFNRPWAAQSLPDFWLRWHMTLSNWVFDYVFRPVSAATRSPVICLLAGMSFIGLWHEFSAYYVVWSLWQALGIMIWRLAANRLPALPFTAKAGWLLGPLLVLAWLSAARPVIEALQGALP